MRSILILLLCGFASFGQEFPLSDFEKSEPPVIFLFPESRTPFWDSPHQEMHLSKIRCFVEVENDTVPKIFQDTISYKRIQRLDFGTGQLVSVNDGEFGGALYFQKDKTLNQFDTVLVCNVSYMLRFKNRLIVLDGFSMGENRGTIFEIVEQNNQVNYIEVLKLDGQPEAYKIHNQKLYIITSGGFYIIDSQLRVSHMYTKQFWYALYPTGIRISKDNFAYVGIRGGYIKFNLDNNTFELFVTKELVH